MFFLKKEFTTLRNMLHNMSFTIIGFGSWNTRKLKNVPKTKCEYTFLIWFLLKMISQKHTLKTLLWLFYPKITSDIRLMT